MVRTLEEMQKLSRDNVEATLKSFGAFSKGVQAIATEIADYSKKAFQDGAAATEKLIGTKSLDAAIAVQTGYLKTAYDGFLAQSAKLGELYAGLAQETCKPFEHHLKNATAK